MYSHTLTRQPGMARTNALRISFFFALCYASSSMRAKGLPNKFPFNDSTNDRVIFDKAEDSDGSGSEMPLSEFAPDAGATDLYTLNDNNVSQEFSSHAAEMISNANSKGETETPLLKDLLSTTPAFSKPQPISDEISAQTFSEPEWNQTESTGVTDSELSWQTSDYTTHHETGTRNPAAQSPAETKLQKSGSLATEKAVSNEAGNLKYVSLFLQKNCTPLNDVPVLDDKFLLLLNPDESANVSVQPTHCKTFLHVQFGLRSTSNSALNSALEMLSKTMELREFKVIKAFAYRQELNVNSFLRFWLRDSTESDLLLEKDLPYVITAFSAVVLLLLFLTFFCVRCSSNKHKSSLDLGDIPHLNLNLEDYKISPIPRPSLKYQDYSDEVLNIPIGRRQSVSDHVFSHDTANYFEDEMYHSSSGQSVEFRTLTSQNQATLLRNLDLHSEKGARWMENYSGGRRALHQKNKLQGIDNACYETWN